MNFDHSKLPPSIPTNLQTSVFSFSPTLPFLDQNFPPRESKNGLECLKCNKIFKRKDHLKRHFQNLHQERKKMHVCEKCGNEFTREDNLRNHEKMHNKEIRFVCKHENCQKTFKSKAKMEFHKLKHEVPKMSCPFAGCNKKFFRESELKRHQKAKKYHLRVFFKNYRQKKKIKTTKGLEKFEEVILEIFILKEKLLNSQ